MAVILGVLAYDIADDRRRRHVRRLLEGYGDALQQSVFFIALPQTRWAELQRRLLKLVRREEDDVRVWPLCAACLGRATAWCGAPYQPQGRVTIV